MIKNEFLQSLVQINCIPVLIIIFLMFFLNINFKYENELSKKFVPSVVLLMMLIIVDNLDYYAFDSGITTGVFDIFHRCMAMLGYDIRILLMSSLIAISESRLGTKKKFIIPTVCIPAAVNVIILLPCLFTDLFFYYNADGSIGRGIFAYEPHILSGFYMLFLFAQAVRCRKRGRRSESEILLLCGILTIFGFLAEFLFALRGILIGVVALDIISYYLYLHIEHFRFDVLTGIFNRHAFIVDIEKYGRNGISHVMSIDLNDLKKLNDNYGHNEGDRALKTTARALADSCLSNCFVYRVGGDEFAAICLHRTTDEIIGMTEKMYSAVEAGGYACAIGYAEWNGDSTFTEIYKQADDMMYRKKREMKRNIQDIGSAPMRVNS